MNALRNRAHRWVKENVAEYEALQEVYAHPCPLLNYLYASVKLVDKAIAKLIRIQQDKNQQQLPFSGSSNTTSGKIP